MSNKTRFIYVRSEDAVVLNKDGEPKKDDDGNVVVARGFPLGCFAYRVVPVLKKGKVTCQELRYGYSVFNPADKFDRKAARVTAEYRLTFDCRATYSVLHDDTHLAKMLTSTAKTEVHQWALSDGGALQPLPMRFRKACTRMAKRLLTAKKSSTIVLDEGLNGEWILPKKVKAS